MGFPLGMSPQQLTTQLKNSQSVSELRKLAESNGHILSAFHDSVISVVCGRIGAEEKKSFHRGGAQSATRIEAKSLFLTAAAMWLNRPSGAFGRDARSCANIMHAGAKLGCDESEPIYRDLLQTSIGMAKDFKAQEASNALWAVATIGCSDASIVIPLARAAVTHVSDFTAQGACNSLWATATLGLFDESITVPLARCCVDRSHDMTAQGASNVLWALATLGVTDNSLIIPIAQVCVLHSDGASLVSQNAANSFWAAASLNIQDESIIKALAESCVIRIQDMSPQGIVNSIWAAATLRLVDENIIVPLALGCVNRTKEFTAQGAANSFWSIATLSLTDEAIVLPLARACVQLAPEFNAQNAANCLWALATLGLADRDLFLPIAQACVNKAHEMNPQNAANSVWSAAALEIFDPSIIGPLAQAVHDRHRQLPRLDDARQCLQAHYAGVALTPETYTHFCNILRVSPKQASSVSLSQMSVFAAFVRLGYHPRLEMPLYDGLVICDIVIEIPDEGSPSGKSKVAVEFDGPTHFLRQVRGVSGVGPVDIQTRIRNTLIRRSKEFVLLITIPFYDWDLVQGKREKEEEYLLQRLGLEVPDS
jgi:predicted lipoprotein